jgi:hypothetical protein
MADVYAMEQDRDVELAVTSSAASLETGSSYSEHSNIQYPMFYQESPQIPLQSFEQHYYQPLPTHSPAVQVPTLNVQMTHHVHVPGQHVERPWLSPQGYVALGAVIGAYCTFKLCVLTNMCNK